MKQIYLAVLITVAVVTPASAADKDGAYNTTGSRSCGDWVKERKEDGWPAVSLAAWVAGYITAYNLHTPDTWDIKGKTDVESVLLWIDNYCQSTPLSNLASAMDELTTLLWPDRTVSAPK
jgi:hypothetical protein